MMYEADDVRMTITRHSPSGRRCSCTGKHPPCCWPPNSSICLPWSIRRDGWPERILLPRTRLLENNRYDGVQTGTTGKRCSTTVFTWYSGMYVYIITYRLCDRPCCWRCASGRRCRPAHTKEIQLKLYRTVNCFTPIHHNNIIICR